MKEINKLNGIMVFYIDVGQLPPFKAEAYLERMKNQFLTNNTRLAENGIDTFWIPVRPNSQTRIDYIPVSDKSFNVQSVSLKPFMVDSIEIIDDA